MTVLVEDTDEDSEPQLRARARRLGAAGIEGEFFENTLPTVIVGGLNSWEGWKIVENHKLGGS